MSDNIDLEKAALKRFKEILGDKTQRSKFLVWNDFFSDKEYSAIIKSEEFMSKICSILSKPYLTFECAQILSERFPGSKEVYDKDAGGYYIDFSPNETEAKKKKSKINKAKNTLPRFSGRFIGLFVLLVIVCLVQMVDYTKDDRKPKNSTISSTYNTTAHSYNSDYNDYLTRPSGSETTQNTPSYYGILFDSPYEEVRAILDKSAGKNIEEMTFDEEDLYKLGEGSWLFITDDDQVGYLTLDEDKNFELNITETVKAKGKAKVIYPEKGTSTIFEFSAKGEKYYLGVGIDKYGIFTGAFLMPDDNGIVATKLLEEYLY
ncbi:MAG: hypothetical protein J6L81_03515 [Clostridia bacterium]|nr:hypothetical protein [Clostridia bacterium]